jgi:glycosyltransferase involved in cell wall biosynthesis
MRIAFVTTLKPRNGAFYGAETSLMYLIESLRITHPELELSIIIRQSYINARKISNSDKEIIKNFFNLPHNNFKYLWLPYVTFPIEKFTLKSFIRYIITYILLLINIFKISKTFKDFDHIHINNTHLFLCQKVNFKSSFSQHVRDLIHFPNLFYSKAKFLISIDRMTYNHVNKSLINKTYILPNLYLIKNSEKIDNVFLEKINKYKFKICIVGQISKIKGVEYVMNEFISLNNTDTCLLIIGGVTDLLYYKKLKKIASKFNNIFFTGDVSNVSEYYKISNFNVRGDEHFCIGRTTIESAIHGLINILPKKNDEECSFEDDPISNIIKNNSFFYNARERDSLKKIFKESIELNYKNNEHNFINPAAEITNKFYSLILT